jgi:nucleoside-diphosphate-sugar epimerase
LVGLLNNPKAMDNIFHITSDEWLTWNQIYMIVGKAFSVVPQLVHVPSEVINRYHKEIGDGLLGDKSHSMIFDNSKIKEAVPEFKCTIPFEEGVKDLAQWYKGNKASKEIDMELDLLFDRMINDISAIKRE